MEARFDRSGEIRRLGDIQDGKKMWIIVRRKGGSRAIALAEVEWLSLALSAADARKPMAARLTVFGIQ
jgi:hypothetical protein